jgi:hypothetical protein
MIVLLGNIMRCLVWTDPSLNIDYPLNEDIGLFNNILGNATQRFTLI